MKKTFYSDLIGKPFRIGAKGPDFYDCYHLVKEVQRRRGYDLPAINTPKSIEMRMALFNKHKDEFLELLNKPEAFSIVIFDAGMLGRLHMGVVLEDRKRFIHAFSSGKSTRISYLSKWPWKKRIFGFYKVTKKLDDKE